MQVKETRLLRSSLINGAFQFSAGWQKPQPAESKSNCSKIIACKFFGQLYYCHRNTVKSTFPDAKKKH
jgi:hypothetical protein